MKLCILGGGGFRTPHVYQALLRDHGSPRIDEVALHDIDSSRLAVMETILAEIGANVDDAPRVVATTDMRSAIAGSDFVFAAVRVGGLQGRRRDEHVALDLGLLGQETTGPGGVAYALRTIPVMLEVAELVKELAPNAYVMNFTNPAGVITEAMQRILGDRVLGICDTPSSLGRRIARGLGLDPERMQLDYVGLNHLGWMRRVIHDGRDVLPDLLANPTLLGAMEEAQIFGADWLRRLGVIPNEYLYYYYRNREAVAGIREADSTRGDYLARTQSDFYRVAEKLQGGVAERWMETVERREASYMAEAVGGSQDAPTDFKEQEPDAAQQGYAGVALSVMAAISRNEASVMILNVRNGSTIQALPDDAVVEVPTLVDANGVRPLSIAQPDLHQLGLMAQVKAVERSAIAAAVGADEGDALTAFAMHPLVQSFDGAEQLFTGYADEHAELHQLFLG
jgi:6-phospho-beta-glucosidase